MTDTRSQKTLDIHNAHYGDHCRSTCPLAQACIPQTGDTPSIFYARMNAAADALESSDG
jgi:hypothetical protein